MNVIFHRQTAELEMIGAPIRAHAGE